MIDITEIISNKVKKLYDLDYKDREEMEFFCEHEQIIFYLDKLKKVYLEDLDLKPISLDKLFIFCQRTYYNDEKFSDLYEKVNNNQKLLIDIITSSVCKLDLSDGVLPNKPFKFYYDIDNEKLKNSVFNKESYIETIKKISGLLYAYINNFDITFFEEVYRSMTDDKTLIKKGFIKNVADNFEKKLWRELGVSKLCSDIYNYYAQLIQNHNKFISNTKTQYYAYMSLLDNLQHIEKLPYTVNVSLTKNIDDETFFALYQYASELNQSFCKELFRQREDLSHDNLKNKKLQLKKCGYDIDRIPSSKLHFLLKYADISELEKIITFLNKLDYCIIDIYSDNGLYILTNTSYEIIFNINELLIKNVVNQSFLNEYPQVFFKKDHVNSIEGMYDKLAINTNLMSNNYEIDNSYINNILLMDNEFLNNNINSLKKYSQKLNNNILYDIKLLDCLDLFIELGFSNYIQNLKIDINGNSYNVIKRYYISKLANFQSKDLKDRIETGLNFYVNDSELDEYIMNNVDDYLEKDIKEVLDNNYRNVISDNELKQFDNYLQDDLTYDFNGLLISKNKILRNLYCLENSNLNYSSNDLLFSAMIYGSILDYEQIEALKDFVYNKKYIKKIGS